MRGFRVLVISELGSAELRASCILLGTVFCLPFALVSCKWASGGSRNQIRIRTATFISAGLAPLFAFSMVWGSLQLGKATPFPGNRLRHFLQLQFFFDHLLVFLVSGSKHGNIVCTDSCGGLLLLAQLLFQSMDLVLENEREERFT